MVKRPKSPEIIEEARYFTVYQPFPLNPNWIFDKDQQDCATWIAECIGLEHLYAIHHKPSARGMILLEVSKVFTQHERLLGEHRWSEILIDADDEERNRVSQVFHSFYSKGRDAQKDGWKVLVVQSSWFKNGVPETSRFKRPYPQTHWCPIPVEDQTNKHLCRPLPVDKKPPPPRVEPPVVGSATWIQKKNLGKPTVEALKMSWDEEISSAEAVNKVNKRTQAKLNAGPRVSVPNGKSPTTTSPSSATSAPKKGQPTSNLVPLGKNKKNNKPLPLNQFINGESGKKSEPATWNKFPPVASAPISPASLNGPVPKPTPRSANAWDKPIKIKLPVAPAVKKETPPEDYSSWGQEPAPLSTTQENIWKSPPTPKKSKKTKDRGPIPETPASSTSQGSTQPSSPQARTIPAISSITRDIPPHQIFRPSEEEEDSDLDDIYVPYSALSAAPEEMEYANVNDLDRGNVNGGDSETSDTPALAEEGLKKYQNLWSSEDDPRAVPLPAVLCPTHHIACKKGICEDMSKILRGIKREKMKAEWEEKKKNKGRRKDSSGSGNDNDEKNNTTGAEVQVDGDNYAIAGPKSKRGRFGGRQKKNQDAPEVNEPSFTGRLRAFTPEPVSSDHAPDDDGVASGRTPPNGGAPEPERQLFNQW